MPLFSAKVLSIQIHTIYVSFNTIFAVYSTSSSRLRDKSTMPALYGPLVTARTLVSDDSTFEICENKFQYTSIRIFFQISTFNFVIGCLFLDNKVFASY